MSPHSFTLRALLACLAALSLWAPSQALAQDLPEDPCPDECTENGWSPWRTVPVQLSVCGGCWVNVTYKVRDMCNNFYPPRPACEVYFGRVEPTTQCYCEPKEDFLRDTWMQFLLTWGHTLPCYPTSQQSTNVLRMTIGACWRLNTQLGTTGRFEKCSGEECCSRDYFWQSPNSWPVERTDDPPAMDFDCEPYPGCFPACGLLRGLFKLPVSQQKPAINRGRLSSAIALTPNPASNSITATWTEAPVGDIVVRIVSLDGGTVIEFASTRAEGTPWAIDIDVSDFAPGRYFIDLEGMSDTRASQSFVVVD
jgi:hypothetical protein